MPPAGEHHHPDESHDEAEDGDEHDPALRVRRHHQCARHQDPDQTTEDLQEQTIIDYYRHTSLTRETTVSQSQR